MDSLKSQDKVHLAKYAMDDDATDPQAQRRFRRPQNSFMLFSNEFRSRIQSRNRHLNNQQISQLLGMIWQKLPLEKRRPFEEEADRIRLAFKARHPDAKFPRRVKRKRALDSSSESIILESGSTREENAACNGLRSRGIDLDEATIKNILRSSLVLDPDTRSGSSIDSPATMADNNFGSESGSGSFSVASPNSSGKASLVSPRSDADAEDSNGSICSDLTNGLALSSPAADKAAGSKRKLEVASSPARPASSGHSSFFASMVSDVAASYLSMQSRLSEPSLARSHALLDKVTATLQSPRPSSSQQPSSHHPNHTQPTPSQPSAQPQPHVPPQSDQHYQPLASPSRRSRHGVMLSNRGSPKYSPAPRQQLGCAQALRTGSPSPRHVVQPPSAVHAYMMRDLRTPSLQTAPHPYYPDVPLDRRVHPRFHHHWLQRMSDPQMASSTSSPRSFGYSATPSHSMPISDTPNKADEDAATLLAARGMLELTRAPAVPVATPRQSFSDTARGSSPCQPAGNNEAETRDEGLEAKRRRQWHNPLQRDSWDEKSRGWSDDPYSSGSNSSSGSASGSLSGSGVGGASAGQEYSRRGPCRSPDASRTSISSHALEHVHQQRAPLRVSDLLRQPIEAPAS
mmetsp:Transcript_12237/g.21217  ORF Transcript_12237/g.21217 Transcript_12237/m.21217 type:complete len:628 (+) Transcript_12237:135-2018(+)